MPVTPGVVNLDLGLRAFVPRFPVPPDPRIPPVGSGSYATAMSIASGPIRATVVEGVSIDLPELVVAFSEPFNKSFLALLQDNVASGMRGWFRAEDSYRYLDQRQMGIALRFNPSDTLPGTYRGTLDLIACDGFRPTMPGLDPFCWTMYSNASGSVPYEVVVREITTTFTPLNNVSSGGLVGVLTTDVPVNVPYNVKAFAGAPFIGASVFQRLGGYAVAVTVPPGTTRGSTVTGNVLIRVCRDSADVCAFPRQGSPFNVTVSYIVQ